jgi:hypothetical protein
MRETESRQLGTSMSELWNILAKKAEPTGSQTLKILKILGKPMG